MLSNLTKTLLLLVAVISVPSLTYAQMAGPYADGPGVKSQPTFVRCMSHDELSKIMENKSMHVIATTVVEGEGGSEVIKAVAANSGQDIMVMNIFPNDVSCVLEIIEGAYINKKFWLENKFIPPAKQERS